MKNSIQHKFFFKHSLEMVWKYLTTAELIEQWLMKNNFQLKLDHSFQFSITAVPELDFDGNVYCTVLEIIPLKKLVYSWKCGPGKGIITLDSIVEWTLHAKENGTELSLNHSGFTEKNLKLYTEMFTGWLIHIQRINENINAANYATTKV